MLYDDTVRRADLPCGLCLRSSGQCIFYVKKGKGLNAPFKIDWDRSSCSNMVKFNYSVAAESSAASPCTNVPITCPWCPSKDPAVWKYNMHGHVKARHSHVSIRDHEDLWRIETEERDGLEVKWKGSRKLKKTQTSRKTGTAMVISEAHTTQVILREVICIVILSFNLITRHIVVIRTSAWTSTPTKRKAMRR